MQTQTTVSILMTIFGRYIQELWSIR